MIPDTTARIEMMAAAAIANSTRRAPRARGTLRLASHEGSVASSAKCARRGPREVALASDEIDEFVESLDDYLMSMRRFDSEFVVAST